MVVAKKKMTHFWEGTPTGKHWHSTNADLDYHVVMAWNHIQSLHKNQQKPAGCWQLSHERLGLRLAPPLPALGSLTLAKWDCNGGSLDIS